MRTSNKLNPLFFKHQETDKEKQITLHDITEYGRHEGISSVLTAQMAGQKEEKEKQITRPDIIDDGRSLSPNVFFKDICGNFIRLLEGLKPDYLLGCQFMLSDQILLNYLQQRKIPVYVIIQKQVKKWYRNGSTRNPRKEYEKKQAIELRDLYDQLTPIKNEKQSVKCIGNVYSTKSKQCQTIFHHKFWILMRRDSPYAVFSGSYNFTFNAKTNYEDANIQYGPSFVLNDYYMKFLEYTKEAESLDFVVSKERKRKKEYID
jgi:hypothetical protein